MWFNMYVAKNLLSHMCTNIQLCNEAVNPCKKYLVTYNSEPIFYSRILLMVHMYRNKIIQYNALRSGKDN